MPEVPGRTKRASETDGTPNGEQKRAKINIGAEAEMNIFTMINALEMNLTKKKEELVAERSSAAENAATQQQRIESLEQQLQLSQKREKALESESRVNAAEVEKLQHERTKQGKEVDRLELEVVGAREVHTDLNKRIKSLEADSAKQAKEIEELHGSLEQCAEEKKAWEENQQGIASRLGGLLSNVFG
jgi:chromosome segregation ATPase